MAITTTANYGLKKPDETEFIRPDQFNDNADIIDVSMKAISDIADSKIPLVQKGAANGVAELGADGKVPSSQLPSYVDDVLEYASQAGFPASGETGKIYVAKDSNKTYRWGGSSYVEISQSLALGETSSTAYRGDRGKAAYEHSQTTGNPHGTTAAQVGAAATVHTHGNLTSDGKIGSTANLPVFTGAGGTVGTKSFQDALSALGIIGYYPNQLINATWNESIAASGTVTKTISHSLGQIPRKAIIHFLKGRFSTAVEVLYKDGSYNFNMSGYAEGQYSDDVGGASWRREGVSNNYLLGYWGSDRMGQRALGGFEYILLTNITFSTASISFMFANVDTERAWSLGTTVYAEVYK